MDAVSQCRENKSDHRKNMRNKIICLLGLVLFPCFLTGCLSVQEQSAFKAAGCPVENMSSLIVSKNIAANGQNLQHITIDGEKLGDLYTADLFSADFRIMKMLPGRHRVDMECVPVPVIYSGEFVAEKGKSYYLLIKQSFKSDGALMTRRIHGVAIVELPPDFNAADRHERSPFYAFTRIEEDGAEWMLYGDNEFLGKCKPVAYLRNK